MRSKFQSYRLGVVQFRVLSCSYQFSAEYAAFLRPFVLVVALRIFEYVLRVPCKQ